MGLFPKLTALVGLVFMLLGFGGTSNKDYKIWGYIMGPSFVETPLFFM